MRPSRVFAAALMTAALVASAVPAYAGSSASSASSTNPASPITGQLDPSASPTPTPTPSPSASSSTASKSGTSAKSSSSNPLAGLTPPASCVAALGGDPTKIQTCLTDAAAAVGGGAGATPPQLVAVQTFLTCLQAAGSGPDPLLAGEKCSTALFTALGIPDTTCLDPTVQPILAALDALLKNQDPSKLQTELEGLGTTLPADLMKIQSCLTPPTSEAPTPTPTPTTTEVNAPATSDPTAAIPVSATPTFTG